MSENLWPNFDVSQVTRSPTIVIEEAGEGLEVRTKQLLRFYTMHMTVSNEMVEASFSLYCRPLSYHFPFLTAKFPIDGFYPVKLVADKLPDMVANDEAELVSTLEKVFNAPSTVETIQRLMSLAQPAVA